jgi:hypothetical protein
VKLRLCRIVLAAIALQATIGTVTRLEAQGLTGQISGTVTDSGGGVMPGATVTVKNTGTNATRDTVTGPDGTFVFPDLLAGTYDIKITIEGFKTYEQKNITLSPSDQRGLDVKLEVGQQSETITVTAQAEIIQTETGAREGVLTAKQIDNLSIIGRSSRHTFAATRAAPRAVG